MYQLRTLWWRSAHAANSSVLPVRATPTPTSISATVPTDGITSFCLTVFLLSPLSEGVPAEGRHRDPEQDLSYRLSGGVSWPRYECSILL